MIEKKCNTIVNTFNAQKCLNPTTNKLQHTKHSMCSKQTTLSAADTGASHNYYSPSNLPKGSIEVQQNPMSVVLPNGKLIASQATIIVPEPKELPVGARTANVFNELTEGSLTSIGQYCDYSCTAVFEKNHACIYHNNRLVLQGNRNHTNKLWYFDLNSKSTSTTNKANAKPFAAHNSSNAAN